MQKLPIVGPMILQKVLNPSYCRMVEGIAQEEPSCVLVSHCKYTQSPLLISMLKKPTVYFCHEPPRSIYEPSINRSYAVQTGTALALFRSINAAYRRRIDKRNVHNATTLIANSHYSAEVLYRVYGRKAIPAQLGVDVNVFYPRKELRENMVLSVGSLNPIKGHDFVIRSLAFIPEKKRPSLVIPSPSGTQADLEKNFLENLAIELRVKIEFRVVTDDDELAGLYSRALATVYCPHLEPFGLVSLESMACGTPVLGVAEGGLRETILHEKTGFLLPWDFESFAVNLQRLADNPRLRDEMGQAGVVWVRKRFTWQRCAETVIEVVEKTISEYN